MIICENINKEFGEPPQRVLNNISLTINSGEFVAISGRSGSGKSTLLYIISSLDLPSQGRCLIMGEDISKMPSDRIHEFRNLHVGFIFQFHYLLSELTALENILLPPRNLGKEGEYEARAFELLDLMSVTSVAHKTPSQMSGGEQQRVAIARALIMNPKYLFADEPTGNLDSENAQTVMKILKKVNKEEGTTVCLVTHEEDFSSMADREIYLVDGEISHR